MGQEDLEMWRCGLGLLQPQDVQIEDPGPKDIPHCQKDDVADEHTPSTDAGSSGCG